MHAYNGNPRSRPRPRPRVRRVKRGGRGRRKSQYPDTQGTVAIERSPFTADHTMVTLIYTAYAQVAPGQETLTYVYSGNSIFDPEVTSGGERPVGYNEWSDFYSKYRVVGSSISVTLQALSAMGLCVYPAIFNGNAASYADAVSQQYAKYVMVGGSSGFNVKRIFHKMGTSKIFGQKIRQDDLYTANFGANPSAAWYWNLYFDTGVSGTEISATITVRIAYHTELFRRKVANRSSDGDARKVITKTNVPVILQDIKEEKDPDNPGI